MTREEMNNKINTIIDECKKNHIWAEYEDDSIGEILNCVSFRITGDWKHEHLAFEYLVRSLFDGVYKICESDIDNTGDDYYSSSHTIYFADESTSILLDKMSVLFE